MKSGELRTRTQGAATVFEVHAWPKTNEMPRVCCSRCVERERVETVSPEWARPNDADAIGRRLASGGAGELSGKDKGRVLYVVEQVPLRPKRRVGAAALLSLRSSRRLELYRLCFNAQVIEHERNLHAGTLITCARAVAREVGAKLHLLVPPGMDPGPLRQGFGFTRTLRERDGRWVAD